eukprot:TRINITY_DN2607_c0_g1_i2.p1 TRINITY_DN2607_c0_g1~~TRINITY_DN2607_c0_g1_i2.p1  ORF type:complete len:187 (+),score=6.63 TRINITY_DN2607_c0_g1_i2:85-645(+)
MNSALRRPLLRTILLRKEVRFSSAIAVLPKHDESLVRWSKHDFASPTAIGIRIFPNFINQEEHAAIVTELLSIFAKKKYAKAHWDKVIDSYKEIEKIHWKDSLNLQTITKVKEMFDPTTKWLFGVHAVDLAPEGRIGAHVDSIKVIASELSLLTAVFGRNTIGPQLTLSLRHDSSTRPQKLGTQVT